MKLHIIIEMLEWNLDPPEIAVAGTIKRCSYIHKLMHNIQMVLKYYKTNVVLKA